MRSERPTEESLFTALYWAQYRQGAGVVRHASVGEPYLQWMRDGTGRADHSVRRIDALVIKRNVAKGDVLWAVEIKVSAADLRNELARPEKTEAWRQYVHAFYFLVPPSLVDIALAEIPKRYGVMSGQGYPTIVRRAQKNSEEPKPLPLDTWRRMAAKLGEFQIEDINRKRLARIEMQRGAKFYDKPL